LRVATNRSYNWKGTLTEYRLEIPFKSE
ncbi:uncharacterized protein METZ01_LOCUS172012, partial [marine metagenome]